MNRSSFPTIIGLVACSLLPLPPATQAMEGPGEYDEDDIEIIEGKDRTVYEYRQNGVLTMIKVVPKEGRAYYMVPADGSAHFESLDHKKNLYPQWVIVEW